MPTFNGSEDSAWAPPGSYGEGGTNPEGGGPYQGQNPKTIDYDREAAKYKLQAAYREHLDREMTDEDFEGWWSGNYGWGEAGINGLDDWIRGIKHEGDRLKAQNQPAPSPPPPTPPPPTPPGPSVDGGAGPPSPPSYGEGGPNPEGGGPYEGQNPTDPPVDLDRAAAKEALRAAYREHLDREMTDKDFEGWWSGNYGWGAAGIDGLKDWLRGIKHEGDRLKALYGPVPIKDPKSTPGTDPEGDPTGVPQRTGRPPDGYDLQKWNDPDHHSTKYDAAAFLHGLTRPSEIAAMVRSAAFQARFPGATFDGKDKIDFGSYRGEDGNLIGVIDVLMGADRGSDTSGGLYWGAPEGYGTTTDQDRPDQYRPGVDPRGGPREAGDRGPNGR